MNTAENNITANSKQISIHIDPYRNLPAGDTQTGGFLNLDVALDAPSTKAKINTSIKILVSSKQRTSFRLPYCA